MLNYEITSKPKSTVFIL